MARRMRQSNSRQARWERACSEVRAKFDEVQTAKQALDDAVADCKTAFGDLQDVQSEYQDWFDNLPYSLQYNSPVGEKLQAVTSLDLDPGDDPDEIERALDEAEAADLPLGWGRD